MLENRVQVFLNFTSNIRSLYQRKAEDKKERFRACLKKVMTICQEQAKSNIWSFRNFWRFSDVTKCLKILKMEITWSVSNSSFNLNQLWLMTNTKFFLSVANIINQGRLPLIIFIADHICFNMSIFCFNTYTIQGIHISRLAYIFVIIVAALQFTIL